MPDADKVIKVGGPPEFLVFSGTEGLHKTFAVILVVMLVIIFMALGVYIRTDAAQLQLLHNDRPIVGAKAEMISGLVSEISDSNGCFFVRFRSGKRTLWISSPVINTAIGLQAGEQKIVRYYDSPNFSAKVTEVEFTTKWLGVFPTTETRQSVSFEDTDAMHMFRRSGTSAEELATEIKAAVREEPEKTES